MYTPATKASAQADSTQQGTTVNKTAVIQSPEQTPLWADIALPIQFSLKVNTPGDKYEQEADRVSEQVMRMPEPAVQRKSCACGRPAGPDGMCEDCKRKRLGIQRMAKGEGGQTAVPPVVNQVVSQPGRPLDGPTRHFMESRFGQDFGRVRVHTGGMAASSAEAVNARAYTVGRNMVFGPGQYRPGTVAGRKLLAHELTHVAQQDGLSQNNVIYRDRYDPAERRRMAEGRVTGTPLDLQIARQCNFQPGDIVFRLGSRELARRIGDPVTHGGIYLGDGLIHDMVGFGNRTVPIVEFYTEAEDASVVKIVRFNGPLRDIIVPRVVRNVRARDFDLPTDAVPWNLFSTATDYRTATCLEYSHAQFLHAIRQINQEPEPRTGVHAQLRATYFSSGGSRPDPLIAPKTLRGGWPVGKIVERWLLVAAADFLAEDVDPSVFRNRWEGNQDESIQAFTYSSFVDATQFFQALDCNQASGEASARYQRQILPISAATRTNVTDPVDRTIIRQSGVVWAQHSSGTAFLTLVRITNSSTSPGRTQITFLSFVDEDLRSRALARAALHQPRGVQTLPWSVITSIPGNAPSTTAQR